MEGEVLVPRCGGHLYGRTRRVSSRECLGFFFLPNLPAQDASALVQARGFLGLTGLLARSLPSFRGEWLIRTRLFRGGHDHEPAPGRGGVEPFALVSRGGRGAPNNFLRHGRFGLFRKENIQSFRRERPRCSAGHLSSVQCPNQLVVRRNGKLSAHKANRRHLQLKAPQICLELIVRTFRVDRCLVPVRSTTEVVLQNLGHVFLMMVCKQTIMSDQSQGRQYSERQRALLLGMVEGYGGLNAGLGEETLCLQTHKVQA
mmetsp:Transcript_11519/g.32358  ORF Transcript_11519/g.32358 Transcript_11519/m.32358 type:complete len:258 (-) Transcript_11519:857-1630(-)